MAKTCPNCKSKNIVKAKPSNDDTVPSWSDAFRPRGSYYCNNCGNVFGDFPNFYSLK